MSGVGFAVNHCDQIDIVDLSAGEGGDIINAEIDPLIRPVSNRRPDNFTFFRDIRDFLNLFVFIKYINNGFSNSML